MLPKRGILSAMRLWLQLALWTDADSIDAVLGPILMFLIACGIAWYAYRRWRVTYGATRWTLTEATIQSEYACNPVSPGLAAAVGGAAGRVVASNTWNAVLQYSYQVDGESYPGFLMLNMGFNSSQDASAAARPWLLKRISVRYNPAHPYESAFLPGDGAPPELRSLGDQAPATSGVISLSLK
jgi:hypothetical protein